MWPAISFPATYQSKNQISGAGKFEVELERTSDQRVVCVLCTCKVGHSNGASVGINSLANDGLNRVKTVALNGIIGGEDNELGNIRLERGQVRGQPNTIPKTRKKGNCLQNIERKRKDPLVEDRQVDWC